ncbi:MAG TPA: hypothetical protein VG736_13040 [Vicinamibacterales bacterium]|jgi:hypothetical protein|nr:hypothetical protein [Vicinamibacterales bacterium]
MRLTALVLLPAVATISIAVAGRRDRGAVDGTLAALAVVERTDAIQTANGPWSELRLVLQPSHTDQADRYATAARAAFAAYGRLLGPFPAATLTIVDPVVDSVSPDLKVRRSEGPTVRRSEEPTVRRSEEPTVRRSEEPKARRSEGPKVPSSEELMARGSRATVGSHATIVAASHWFAPWTTAEPEMAVVQGIGRVYWRTQASVDDDERRLREALATFTAARVFADAFPNRFVRTQRYFRGLVTWPYSDAPWTKDVDGYLADVALDPTADPADIDRAHDVLALATLEQLVGAETMDRILRAYAARGASAPAAPADFEAIAGEVSGRDLTWFFDATRQPDVAFDYAVDEAETGAGAVVVRRLAAGAFPLDVRVTFDDGSSRVERWDGRDARRTFEYGAAPAIATVEIDPDDILRLDVHRTNNSWSAHPRGRRAARTWSLRWLVWFQHTLMDYAFVA